mgnify:CR=1 FL=1
MIKSSDLFSIAKSGVNASNRLLQTTSNNIANINTEGYIRERTEFKSELVGGVDKGFTDRVFSVFAQNQLRRDITQVGEYQAIYDRSASLDNVLASEANSISSSMTRFFASVQTASDDPTNMPARDAVLGEAEGLVKRINTLGDFMQVKESEIEQQIQDSVKNANALITQIGDLNRNIAVLAGTSNVDTPSKLLNERDLAIQKLAEYVSIETRKSPNNDGGLVVNLTSGESLVLADGQFNVFAAGGSPDYTNRQLVLSTQFNSSYKEETTLNVREENLGGALGGLFHYREEILEPAQRDLGKLAMGLADALNTQNRQGMDLDQQLGGDIFTLPNFRGINYPGNSDLGLGVQGRFTGGQGGEISNSDYRVTVLSAPAGAPASMQIQVEAMNNDDTPQLNVDGQPIVETYTVTAQAGEFNRIMGGIELEFASGAAYSVGDAFLFQPLRSTASNLSVATGRAEDLAFAKPLRVDTGADNLGDARVTLTTISNSLVDNSFANPSVSAFNGAGGLHTAADTPAGSPGAPTQIRFTDEFSYQVLDADSNVLGTVTNASDLNNLIDQAKQDPAWPSFFGTLENYPGYDFSLEGRPKAGDVINISFNTDGLADNRNVVEMAGLQQRDLVRQSTGSNANKATFNEAYASIVADVGSATSSAKINLEAAKVMQQQSADWHESTSGVSLDEEAANLIQYQQSYAAAARILSTAQELFDTILSFSR